MDSEAPAINQYSVRAVLWRGSGSNLTIRGFWNSIERGYQDLVNTKNDLLALTNREMSQYEAKAGSLFLHLLPIGERNQTNSQLGDGFAQTWVA